MIDAYIRKVAEVRRVLDGDTVELCIDLGHNTYHTSKHRLAGFDAPETWRPSNEAELAAGKKVSSYLTELLDKYKDSLYVQTSKDPKIYGRYNATLYALDSAYNTPININELVISFMTNYGLTKTKLKV
jgi:micrococcal nuclease